MFLSVMLICSTQGLCEFKSLSYPFPTLFECVLSIEEGKEFFAAQPGIDYVEGRCIKWGQLIGGRS